MLKQHNLLVFLIIYALTLNAGMLEQINVAIVIDVILTTLTHLITFQMTLIFSNN